MDGMNLVGVLTGHIVETQNLRGAVARVDDAALLGLRRHADVNGLDGLEGAQWQLRLEDLES